MNEHEHAFVTAFIVAERRERYLTLLSNPKRRAKILNRLNHHLDFNRSLATELGYGSPDSLAEFLEAKGAKATCYVIADNRKLDGQELPLAEACWHAFTDGFGIVLSCVPGQLAFYRPEAPGPGFILERKRP